MTIKIAPSLLAADMLNLGDQVKLVEDSGADWHHFDVMDGHFVPNLSFGLPLVESLKSIAKIPLDVHIMVSNPDSVAMDYVRAGADILVFHWEAAVHHHRIMEECKKLGAKVGVAINPATPLTCIFDLLDYLDTVNIMTVNPGFGGQKFIPKSLSKISHLSRVLEERKLTDIEIQVDGGVTVENAPELIKAGASVLVAGSSVYKSENIPKAIKSLKQM